MFAPSVGTVKDGEHAFATSGGTAWRRRQRRLRAFRRFVLWHSKIEVAAALHHSSGLRTSTAAQFSSTAVEPTAPRVVGSLPPAEEFTRPVYGHVHQEQFAAGEMSENMVEFPVVQEQVIVQAIPVVVGSLPPAEEFTEPVNNHIHQEQFSAGETTENIAEIPVVQEQVIVQAFPEVVGSLPPAEEFSAPVYYQIHQEQFSAGETTENIAEIPVVQEQVIVQAFPEVVDSLPPAQEFSAPVYGQVNQVFVGLRPERLVDARGPHRCGRTVPSVGAPVLAVQSLRGFDGVDNTAAKFLLQQALKKKKEVEEEERRKREEELRADEKKLEARERKRAKALKGWDEEALLQLNRRIQAGSTLSSAEYAAWYYWDGGAPSSSSASGLVKRRKRKKKRKKKLPSASSHSSSGRARRRQRQCQTLDRGVVLLLAVFPTIVDRPEMPCIMAGLVQKDRCRGLYIAGIAGYDAPRTVFVFLLAGMDQMDSCLRRTGYWFFWEMTSMSFCIQRSACFESGYMHCVILRCLKHLTYFQVCLRIQRSAWFDSGYMRCVILRGFSGRISHVFNVKVFDVPFVPQRQIPMVLLFSRPQRFPSCRSFSGVDVPVVQVVQVHFPVGAQRQSPGSRLFV